MKKEKDLASISLYIEQSILASLLYDPNRISLITQILQPGDFKIPKHQVIFQSLLDLLQEEGAEVAPGSLKKQLDKDNNFEKVGGSEMLKELEQNKPWWALVALLILFLKNKE